MASVVTNTPWDGNLGSESTVLSMGAANLASYQRLVWCGRGDLNPHAFRRHPLKMVCLPISPLPHTRPDADASRSRAERRGRASIAKTTAAAKDCNASTNVVIRPKNSSQFSRTRLDPNWRRRPAPHRLQSPTSGRWRSPACSCHRIKFAGHRRILCQTPSRLRAG